MSGRYSTTAIVLHWTIAVLILGLLGVGNWMTSLDVSPTKIQVYTWHKWIGITVLMLVLVRIGWRLTHAPPPLPVSLPRWQLLASRASHAALYGLMLAMPITGWLQNSAAGFPLTWFGWFKVPALMSRDKSAFEFWQGTHEWLAWCLVALIAVHVAAAIKHAMARDGVFSRIWFTRS
jgi:cytochrome b561